MFPGPMASTASRLQAGQRRARRESAYGDCIGFFYSKSLIARLTLPNARRRRVGIRWQVPKGR